MDRQEAGKSRGNATLVQKMRNPSYMKSRGKNVRRKWRKKKMKGPKGEGGKLKDDSVVVDSSNEFENSMNSPNDYWPEFYREFSTQQSRLNSITMDVDDSNDNKLISGIVATHSKNLNSPLPPFICFLAL
ncbi:hypothetical protein C2S52_000564 [Perilla frutescens var. hirtella]|nr:hypothetical protein C2S51_007854 [Perilla frutescens var. frutescens]KAH6800100.1 hypothetical protein C2S52_000564 [Perilla frutescens var. hirtella]